MELLFPFSGIADAATLHTKIIMVMLINTRFSSKIVRLILCSCIILNYTNCPAAQTSLVNEGSSAQAKIEVQGIRDPDWKPYDAMLKGVNTFEAKHDFAPTAELRFILIPRRLDVNMSDLRLKLEGDNGTLAIPLEEGNVFVLPVEQAMLHAQAELTLNRKAGSVRWLPYIRSSMTSDTIRRMGDLRLACEVHWTIDRETLPFVARSTISALGGPCNFISEKGRYSFSEPKRIISATISSNGETEALPVDGYSFTPPLRDKRWSNDSVIELKFEND